MVPPPSGSSSSSEKTDTKSLGKIESSPGGEDPYYDGRSYPEYHDGREQQPQSGRYRDGRMGQISQSEEEGVEVVLSERGSTKVVDPSPSQSRPTPDQNVFRVPHAVRPRPARPSGASHVQGSGSFSYAHPGAEYPPPHHSSSRSPYPPYPSGSFDDGASYHARHGQPPQPPSHYSPHVKYPPPGGRYPSEEVNVISPNHKVDPKYQPPANARSRHSGSAPHHPHSPHHSYYQYPPTSPVSRPGTTQQGNSPPRLRNFPSRRSGGGTSEGPYSKAQRGEQHHPDDGTWNPFPAPSRTGSGEHSSHHGHRPQIVTESSFDSDHYSGSHYSHPSHPPTPGSHLPPHHDPHQHFYNGSSGPPSGGPSGAGSWCGSFDSSAHPPPYDDYRHGQGAYHPPESPYSPYSPYPPYHSPSGYYNEPYPPGYHQGYGPPPHSYEEDERGMLRDYHPDRDGEDHHHHHHHHHHGVNAVTPMDPKKARGSSTIEKAQSGMVLPKAAQEVDFEVTDPPMEPVSPPSTDPVCESLADVNSYDVLCGRGGGTNSQIGNKRFRKLVQEFQPTYLLARRKEKPLLARTIVLIIRKRGGRFLRKDEDTGMLYEVGDAKAEAKTSQALREGLDVRATKSAANSLMDKKKKKKKQKPKTPATPTTTAPASTTSVTEETVTSATSAAASTPTTTKPTNAATTPTATPNTAKTDAEETAATPVDTPEGNSSANTSTRTIDTTETATTTATDEHPEEEVPTTPPPKSETTEIKTENSDSPPVLPRLQDEEGSGGSGGASNTSGVVHPHSPEAVQFRKRRRMRTDGCGADKFFPDFCPPRADLARTASPIPGCEDVDDDVLDLSRTPQRRNPHHHGGPPHPHGHPHPHGPPPPRHHPYPHHGHHGHRGPPHPYETEHIPAPGCADIALSMMSGGEDGGFCMAPKWK